ncbi:MAG: hypothetical protein QXZ66_00395 [Thermoproteota archaeon]
MIGLGFGSIALARASVVLDFIRFESPMAGLDYFLTCFCPSCREEMKSLGYNPVSIKRDWLRMMDFLARGSSLRRLLDREP